MQWFKEWGESSQDSEKVGLCFQSSKEMGLVFGMDVQHQFVQVPRD